MNDLSLLDEIEVTAVGRFPPESIHHLDDHLQIPLDQLGDRVLRPLDRGVLALGIRRRVGEAPQILIEKGLERTPLGRVDLDPR